MVAVVDAAIGWLVESILGILVADKLKEWIHGVGLADDVERLKSEVEYVQGIHAAAKGRKIENEPLARSLDYLKELLYDAEDVLDELDYYRLQEQVTPSGSATSSTWSSSFLKKLESTLPSSLSNIIPVGQKRKRDTNISEFSRIIQHTARELRKVGTDVSDVLKIDGSNFDKTSGLNQSTPDDKRLTSKYLPKHKVYGRDAQKDSILKLMMTSDKSTDITVLPIIGIGGVGKTTLAQFVYNDLEVEKHFKIKIWVCVSDDFNVTRMTREMLHSFPEQRQSNTTNLNNLQEDLERELKSHRFLIVLDDVWDDMDKDSWNKLLAPLQSNKATGNMILVTTRKPSVAEMIRTVKAVELDALEWDDLWSLFKSCAFGDGKYEEYPCLHAIGKQIAQKLRGNPLAIKAVGALLKRNMDIDHWTNILHNKEWKSLKDCAGIMSALKLSYDYLPGHLQQCFRYCCLFPKDYRFDRMEIVRMWISQGFVHGNHTGKKLEDTGRNYFFDLVDSGFFELDRWDDEYFLDVFVMHDLIHDLACEVSKSEFATINGSECEEILPTVRHLSIITGSTYHGKGLHWHGFPCESFEKKLKQVKSVTKLRSLVLIGGYDSCFFKCFQNMFKEAQSLRLLSISTSYADFDTFISKLVSCTHIRYIKVSYNYERRPQAALPQDFIKFFHLQVLDVKYVRLTLPSGVNNLVNLQHLFIGKEMHSTISSIGNMIALQELPKFKVQNASGFDIRQLKFMNQLVQLGVYQLENVGSKQEATDARLIDKGHLEDLVLSWDASSASSGTSPETSTEVLGGLKPHQKLKHLKIIGYNGSLSPSWLAADLSVTTLQSVRLKNCKAWRVLPPFEKLPCLRKLKLINMGDVVEATIPCLEELELRKLPRLENCVVTDRKGLNYGLQNLTIQRCPELKDFALFQIQNLRYFEVEQNLPTSNLEGTSAEFPSTEAEQMEWLPGLRELRILGCPRLGVLPPMPPAAVTNLQIDSEGLSTRPGIKLYGSTTLYVGSYNELRVLDSKILAFQNLRSITSLRIEYCPNLACLPSEGFKQILNLEELVITGCGDLVSSSVIPNAASEGWKATECPALANLTRLIIVSCGGIAGRWLTEMLPHMQSLVELRLEGCPKIKSVSIHPHVQVAESASLASDSGCQTTCLTHDEFHLHIPSNVLSTVNKLHIESCDQMQLCSSTEGFRGFTSLAKLRIHDCPKLFSSLDGRFTLPPSIREFWIKGLPSKLEPYFPENETSLKQLMVEHSPHLQSLSLQSCTALEKLSINGCGQLAVLEGVQYLSSLKMLNIEMTPEVSAAWVRTYQEQEEVLPVSLEELGIEDPRGGAMPYFLGAHLPSLSGLDVWFSPNLTSLQLGSLTALKSLKINSCESLSSLEGLQSLVNLRELLFSRCYSVSPCLELMCSQHAEGSLLLSRLEGLTIDDLAVLTTSFCKHLTSLKYLELIDTFCSRCGTSSSYFTDEQDEALQLLTSLQELCFMDCGDLIHLPAALHSLSSLRKLSVSNCQYIVSLPEEGLPPSLEELRVFDCNMELEEQCRNLAIDKLNVRFQLSDSEENPE